MRIVSFVPAATELACRLGRRSALVGVTHSCGALADLSGVAPRVLTRSRVPTVGRGGAVDGAVKTAAANRTPVQSFDPQSLAELAPDVVIVPAPRAGSAACSVEPTELRRALLQAKPVPRMVEFGPATLQEVLGSTRALGEALEAGADAARLVAELKSRVEHVVSRVEVAAERPRVALLCWLTPPMGAGGLWAELVGLAGGRPVVGDPGEPVRPLDWAHVVGVAPEVVLAAPCDFTLERARAEAEVLARVPGMADTPAARWGQVHALEARRWFSAPGPAAVRGLEILAGLIHPELPWPEAMVPRDAWCPVAMD